MLFAPSRAYGAPDDFVALSMPAICAASRWFSMLFSIISDRKEISAITIPIIFFIRGRTIRGGKILIWTARIRNLCAFFARISVIG